MTHEERTAFGLAVYAARQRMRMSRLAFYTAFSMAYPDIEFSPARLRRVEEGCTNMAGDGPAKRANYSWTIYVNALSNFCNIKPEEYMEMSTLGTEIRKAREARGLSRAGFVAEYKAANPTAAMSEKSIKNMELHNKGSEQMFQAVATFLGVPYNDKGIVNTGKKPKASALKIDAVATSTKALPNGPVVQAPFTRAGARAKQAEAGKVLHTSFNTPAGFSLVAARDTLAQLRVLGLPTTHVKQAMIQKFTEYVNALDK